MEILDILNQYSGVLALALLIVVLILIIMVAVSNSKIKKLHERIDALTAGKDAESLEPMMLSLIEDVKNVKVENRKMAQVFGEMNKDLNRCYKKIGMVKYDAFRGLTGKLSFAICLLDGQDSGYIQNVMHGNGGCYTYTKEIIRGEAIVPLSNEEKKALESALTCDKE